MRKKHIIIIVLISIFILLQFLPIKHPIVIEENKNDLIANNDMDESISRILKNSCYDCHSFETNLPWYSSVFPSSLLVSVDTEKGRKELNFSDWESMSKFKKLKNLNKIEDEVLDGEMPMKIYVLMHRDAQLSEKDKEILVNWINVYQESLIGK